MNTVVATQKPHEALAAIIEGRGLRKGHVARIANLPASSLSSLLSGKREFSPYYAVRLAKALGVPVETFLEGDA